MWESLTSLILFLFQKIAECFVCFYFRMKAFREQLDCIWWVDSCVELGEEFSDLACTWLRIFPNGVIRVHIWFWPLATPSWVNLLRSVRTVSMTWNTALAYFVIWKYRYIQWRFLCFVVGRFADTMQQDGRMPSCTRNCSLFACHPESIAWGFEILSLVP